MSADGKSQLPRLQNDLFLLAFGMAGLCYLLWRAIDHVDHVRRELLEERSRSMLLVDERDQAKHDLDGALERLHAHMEANPGQDKPTPARARQTRPKSA